MAKKYRVECLNCKEGDTLTIDDSEHIVLFWEKIMLTPIKSARWRKDMKWGFECKCGNYDLLCEEEKPDFDKYVAGSPDRLAEITRMLNQKGVQRFKLEVA